MQNQVCARNESEEISIKEPLEGLNYADSTK
jgi:hypothetical protein